MKNCLIQLVAKDFESECKDAEPWYNTLFQKLPLTTKQLQMWKHFDKSEDLSLLHPPPSNPYIPDDFSICCEREAYKDQTCMSHSLISIKSMSDSDFNSTIDSDFKQTFEEQECSDILSDTWLGEPPQILLSNNTFTLWFKMDQVFKQPKLSESDDEGGGGKKCICINKMKSALLLRCFEHAMRELTYVFSEAGLSWSIEMDNTHGINAFFFGYNQTLPILIETVLSKFADFKLTQVTFFFFFCIHLHMIQSFVYFVYYVTCFCCCKKKKKKKKEQFEVNLERFKRQLQSLRKSRAHQQVALFRNYVMSEK
ncbi:hypothetical protein RFI_14321 [Reticulomyxa filosa]|uniref:Peptidase M16 middle/third domain-containing protein n=1 Tax=Reticulomyxa filosa TaxID=46433 RepID=X6NAV5_RETFI|nr:hypothetical protein RFI_14321 [Reticulomyxa filosa]|eukprot:ETO22874.1 hypothetical protein RFI_14321 [Reticulomyxa filosa]